MFVSDPLTRDWFHANVPEADFIVGGVCAVLVVVIGLWLQKRGAAAKAHAKE
jgi:hypothetical protein